MAESKTAKRARAADQTEPPGREQLLLSCPQLQLRLCKKYCDETELVSLLLTHGFVRRVRTIQVEVHPLGGDSFKVTLDACWPSVGEAKTEIARAKGTPEIRQELYKVAVSADGAAVREDDAEPDLLPHDGMALEEGDVVTLAIKGVPVVWRTFAEDRVALSEDRMAATQDSGDYSLVTSGVELTEGRHYFEVEIFSRYVHVGVTRPNLDPNADYCTAECKDGWFIGTYAGELFGNGKLEANEAGRFDRGDRVGVLLDLDDGSLRFFRNGCRHGPGYPPGSVTGPVVHALQLVDLSGTVNLVADAAWPTTEGLQTRIQNAYRIQDTPQVE
jgi:hypothetical protein